MDNEKNTLVCYRYTDASNYHARNEAIICGILTSEQKRVILDCLDPDGLFVPGAVGLDVELPWEFDPQDDHPFWSLDEDSFEETSQRPTVNISADAFVRAFVENKDRWEELGVVYMPDYEEEYGSVDVAAMIDEAKNRCAKQSAHSDKDIELI